MVNQNAERFNRLMLGMADNFRDTITAEGIRLRWEMLKGYSIEEVEKAGFEIIRKRKYIKMPPIAEFISEIEGDKAPVEIAAEKQWSIIIGEVRRVGSYGTPTFTDPITKRLFSTRFRFSDLCRAKERELSYTRHEFLAAYNAESIDGYQNFIDYHRQSPKMQGIAGDMLKRIEN